MSPPMQVETSSYAYDSATNKEMNKGLILRWKALAIAGISLSPPPPPPPPNPPTNPCKNQCTQNNSYNTSFRLCWTFPCPKNYIQSLAAREYDLLLFCILSGQA